MPGRTRLPSTGAVARAESGLLLQGVQRETPGAGGRSAPRAGRSGDAVCCQGCGLAAPTNRDSPSVTGWAGRACAGVSGPMWRLCVPTDGAEGVTLTSPGGWVSLPGPCAALPAAPWAPGGQGRTSLSEVPVLNSQLRFPCCLPALRRPDSRKPGICTEDRGDASRDETAVHPANGPVGLVCAALRGGWAHRTRRLQ